MTNDIAMELSKLIRDYFENKGMFPNSIFAVQSMVAKQSPQNPGQILFNIEGSFFKKYRPAGIPQGVAIIADPSLPKDKAIIVDGMGCPIGTIENIGEPEDHTGHDVVENSAGGKSFKYCRNCKVEVP